jgi:hypothetical protein
MAGSLTDTVSSSLQFGKPAAKMSHLPAWRCCSIIREWFTAMYRALARSILLPSLLPGLRFCRAASSGAPSVSTSTRSAPDEHPLRRGKRTRAWQLANGLAAGMAADIVTAGSVVLRQASLERCAGRLWVKHYLLGACHLHPLAARAARSVQRHLPPAGPAPPCPASPPCPACPPPPRSSRLPPPPLPF